MVPGRTAAGARIRTHIHLHSAAVIAFSARAGLAIVLRILEYRALIARGYGCGHVAACIVHTAQSIHDRLPACLTSAPRRWRGIRHGYIRQTHRVTNFMEERFEERDVVSRHAGIEMVRIVGIDSY